MNRQEKILSAILAIVVGLFCCLIALSDKLDNNARDEIARFRNYAIANDSVYFYIKGTSAFAYSKDGAFFEYKALPYIDTMYFKLTIEEMNGTVTEMKSGHLDLLYQEFLKHQNK